MKRNISDLMDHYRGELPELQMDTPLSSQRIKELTMGKITKSEKKGKRIVFRILVAAALIATLTMTAFASEDWFDAGSWFREVLNLQMEKDQEIAGEIGVAISEGQVSEGTITIVNQLAQGFRPQTQTDQGTTVTLQAAYGGDYMLHLLFHVEAPEGTVLPDDILYDFCDHNAIDYSRDDYFRMLYPGVEAPYKYISHSMEINVLPDADPTDHCKDFHVKISGQKGDKCRFNDGQTKYFQISGIYQQVVNANQDEDGYELLAPGNFRFDVGLSGELEEIELKEAEGFTYGGEKTRTWTHDSPCLPPCEENLTGETDPENGLPIHTESYNYEVEVVDISISPMGVDWEVKYTCDDWTKAFGLSFQVVMKDGRIPVTTVGSASDNGKKMAGITYFTVPIDLAEVDYIRIGDEELGQTMILHLPE